MRMKKLPLLPSVLLVPSLLFVLLVLSVAEGTSAAEDGFAWKPVDDKSLGLFDGGKPVLVYNHGMILKKGVPERYRRACYLHPVYGLDGEVITDDFPRDHRHHRGIFWAWPIMKIRGKAVQTWHLEGLHQRHVRWNSRTAGPASAVLDVSINSAWGRLARSQLPSCFSPAPSARCESASASASAGGVSILPDLS